jgi:hypothetical protein
MTNHVGTMADGGITAHKLDVAGWGLFFIWIGIAVLANLGWGIGLAGVGVLVISGQLARKYMGLTFEAFWAVVGAVFVLGGIWEILSVRVSLIPILCIAAGVALLGSVLVGKPKE